MSDKERIQSVRTENSRFDTYAAPEILDIFADGIGQVYAGPIVTKLEFYRTIGFEGEGQNRTEKREMFMRLVIPSPQLFEAFGNILSNAGASLPVYDQATKEVHNLIVTAIKKVQDVKL